MSKIRKIFYILGKFILKKPDPGGKITFSNYGHRMKLQGYFSENNICGAPGGPTSVIFATIYYDPLNFEVNRVNRVIRPIKVIIVISILTHQNHISKANDNAFSQ